MGNLKIFVRTNFKNKKGQQPVAIQYCIEHRSVQFNIGVNIDSKNWDPEKKLVLFPESEYDKKNLLIKSAVFRAEKILFDYQVKNKYLTCEDFKSLFLIKPEPTSCFYAFVENELKLKINSIRNSTLKQYKGELTKLKQFRKKLTIEEVNSYLFFQKYEHYMRTELKNKTNTVGKTLKKIKALLQVAYKKGIINKIETTNYQLKYEQTNRTFLSMDEVNNLELLLHKDISDTIKNTVRCFLFCCYTGLRYMDLHDLTYSSIINGSIEIKQQKTDKYLKLPLCKKALTFIDQSKLNTHEKIFNVFSNQKMNEYIKVATFMINIKKSISFHCSRHTFATISLNLGIPLNVVSTFLGHTDLKTTLIYAKLLENTKADEMSKWDSF